MEMDSMEGAIMSVRDRIAKINYEAFTGLSWNEADKYEKFGALKHTGTILSEIEKEIEGMKDDKGYVSTNNTLIDKIIRRLKGE